MNGLRLLGKSVGVRLAKLTGKRPYAIHPKYLVEQPWHDWYLPYLERGAFVHTPWDGVIDAVGGVSLSFDDRLSRWKREAALRRPGECPGFRVVAWKRP